MYTILFDNDKNLITSLQTNIYTNDNLADLIHFLLPCKYGEYDISQCDILLGYIFPNDTGNVIPLSLSSELYKNHLEYKLPIDSNLTSVSGEIKLFLKISNADMNMDLTSGYAVIHILPTLDYTEIETPPEDPVIDIKIGTAKHEAITESQKFTKSLLSVKEY